MPAVTVGDTRIPYRLRRSARAKRLRIVVTPGQVEVVAPRRAREADIRRFVDAKRRWLYAKTRALRDRSLEPLPPRFVDGARVLYQGTHLTLRVEPGDGDEPGVRHAASELHVQVACRLDHDGREERTRDLVVSWLAQRALEEADAFVQSYAPKLGKGPKSLRIGNQKTLWGSCSPKDVISLNWRLIAAPAEVFEYVVVHELCHLREKNHSSRFWGLVEGLMPDYRERRAWLKEHGVGLG